jgi:hypothetical protein
MRGIGLKIGLANNVTGRCCGLEDRGELSAERGRESEREADADMKPSGMGIGPVASECGCERECERECECECEKWGCVYVYVYVPGEEATDIVIAEWVVSRERTIGDRGIGIDTGDPVWFPEAPIA